MWLCFDGGEIGAEMGEDGGDGTGPEVAEDGGALETEAVEGGEIGEGDASQCVGLSGEDAFFGGLTELGFGVGGVVALL